MLTFSLARGFDFVLSLGVTDQLITSVMGISCLGSFWKDCFDILKSRGFWDSVRQIGDNLIGSTLVELCEIWLGGSLGCKLQDDQ